MIDKYRCNETNTRRATHHTPSSTRGLIASLKHCERFGRRYCASLGACEPSEPGRLTTLKPYAGTRRSPYIRRCDDAHACWPGIAHLREDLRGLELVDVVEAVTVQELLGDYWPTLQACTLAEIFEASDVDVLAALLEGDTNWHDYECSWSSDVEEMTRAIVLAVRLADLLGICTRPLEESFKRAFWAPDASHQLLEAGEPPGELVELVDALDLDLDAPLPVVAIDADWQAAHTGSSTAFRAGREGHTIEGGHYLRTTIEIVDRATHTDLSEEAYELLEFRGKGRPIYGSEEGWSAYAEVTWREAFEASDTLAELLTYAPEPWADVDDRALDLGALPSLVEAWNLDESALAWSDASVEPFQAHYQTRYRHRDVSVTLDQLRGRALAELLGLPISPEPGSFDVPRYLSNELTQAYLRIAPGERAPDWDDSWETQRACLRVHKRIVSENLDVDPKPTGDLAGWFEEVVYEMEGGHDD